MIDELQMPHAEMERLVKAGAVCRECQRPMSTSIQWRPDLGKVIYVFRCSYSLKHEGYERPYQPNPMDIPGFNLYENRTRRATMEQRMSTAVGPVQARHLASYSQSRLTKELATEIINSVWSGAPPAEVYKAAMICQQYGLNPLMGHLALVRYKIKKWDEQKHKRVETGQETWRVIIPIKASRLILSQKPGLTGYSYTDGPRVMTEAEEKAVYGRPDPALCRSIVRMKAMINGLSCDVVGYGQYGWNEEVTGVEKGNSVQNMSFIRAERQAIDKLAPGAIPGDVEVADEFTVAGAGNGRPQLAAKTVESLESEDWPEEAEESGAVPCTENCTASKAEPGAASAQALHSDSARRINSIQELYKACHQDFGLQPKQVLDMLKVDSPSRLTEAPGDLYMEIAKEVARAKR